MNNMIEYNIGNDPSLLILDDDEPLRERSDGQWKDVVLKSKHC